ncbi:hypothetical protein GCM10023238_25000 [Streptomyces heliomycini]
MPLHVPPAPAPALRSVLTALSSPTAVREARTPSLLVAQGPASPELPLPVHVLDRTTPDSGTTTRLTGWRFLIRTGDRAVAAADTVLTANGWTFSRFFEGPYITSTELALRQADAMTQPVPAPAALGAGPLHADDSGCTATPPRTAPPATRAPPICSSRSPRHRPASRPTARTGSPTCSRS